VDSTRTTTRDIRRQNRSILLSKLFFDGPLSRLELSQLTGLSSGTVSTVTAELIDDRLVVEAGQVESGGGRPRVLLRVDPAYGYVVGVDVGETGVTVELFDIALQRLASVSRRVASHRPDPETVVAEIVGGISDVLAQRSDAVAFHAASADEPDKSTLERRRPVKATDIVGVGVGVPGIVADDVLPAHSPIGPARSAASRAAAGRTSLVHAPTIGWEGVGLGDMLAEAGVTAPIFVGNGAKTQAQAEMWFGAARGARHAIVALVGSGVGAAVISDGVPYQGTTSSAGEWGHTTLVYGGRQCRCGARGCLEAYVGAEGILDRYAASSRRDTGDPDKGDPNTGNGSTGGAADEMVAIATLVAAAIGDRSDSAAADLLAETAAFLGTGIGNLINLFNPERVVLGGWAGLALGSVALPQIRAAAETQALAHPYDQVRIELSELGLDAVALGAATLPLAELLQRGDDPRRP
jgi:predicted NBD/HSP70 family sugar kinase